MTAVEEWLSPLVRSHEHLKGAVGSLAPDQVTAASYDTEWSIADVLSHIGSQSEIFELFVQAGIDGSPAPEFSAFTDIWDRWNAKAPIDQVTDALAADRALLDGLGGLTDEQQASWSLEMFGDTRTLAGLSPIGLLPLRLGEHAVHTWDVLVMDDPSATVAADAVALLIDVVHQQVERITTPHDEPLRVRITTQEPTRQFVLTLDHDGAHLQPGDSPDGAPGGDHDGPTLELPAEALIRLFYGRLDPAHTPASVTTEGIALDRLRSAFPGV
jgi:uncharacterized protein (TIGR03083 family)